MKTPAIKTTMPQTAMVAAIKSEELVAVVMPSTVLGDGTDSGEESIFPISCPQLVWRCHVNGPLPECPLEVDALIDNGSSLVLIDEQLVSSLGLHVHELPHPIPIGLALTSPSASARMVLSCYVNLSISSLDSRFQSHSIRAVITPNLVKPLLLSYPFLTRNNILIDHASCSCVVKGSNYDLFHPPMPMPPRVTPMPVVIRDAHAAVQMELHWVLPIRKTHVESSCAPVVSFDCVAAVQARLCQLVALEELAACNRCIKDEYHDCFPVDIPHCDSLPDDVLFRVRPKDASKVIQLRSYN